MVTSLGYSAESAATCELDTKAPNEGFSGISLETKPRFGLGRSPIQPSYM